ncbi:kinase-like protein, partial [Obba rivulosa]
MVDSSEMASSPTPPSVGTLIDNGALELVEVLGYGGYGVVYRAIDTYSSSPTSYAVKCLPHSQKRNASRQRQLHLREITLHQLASAHPNVVTLHRVVEDYHYTYIVMDYCSDGDLFTQILHQRRYLGHNELIKEVFLQLLDAVEYCHSLSIYHRDLKPENILCFDGGLRLAITDFGLATTDKMSTEFRTGSIYHMSPECQGGLFAYTKAYSPLFNDVWSLGIILLNLITGRNPWKSASADDVTFQAYLKDPLHFLPTVLPISEEVNRLLVRVLEVDWRRRMTLREMRIAFKGINSFYAPDVLFEDSMARCPWEAGVTAGSDSSSEPEAEAEPQDLPEDDEFASAWSNDSDSEMIFANQTATEKLSWVDDASREARHPCEYNRSMSPSPGNVFTNTRLFEQLQSCGSSPRSSYSVLSSSPSIPSLPRTPNGVGAWSPAGEVRRPKLPMLDTNGCHTQYYNESVTMLSARSSSMHTALETHIEDYGIYSAAFFDDKSRPYAGDREDVGMITTPLTANEESMPIQLAISCYPTIHADESLRSACPESPVLGLNPLGLDLNFPTQRHEAGSHESYNWEQVCMPPPSTATTAAFSFLTFDTTLPSPQTESAWHSLCFAAPPPPTPDPQHERAHAPSPLPFPFRDYPP